MIKLNTYKNQKISIKSLCCLLFYSLPVSFILGSLIVNLNVILLLISSLILIKKNKLSYDLNIFNLLLLAFFSYIFLHTLLHYQTLEYIYLIKSFFLIRFAFLAIFINILISHKIVDLKKFFIICCVCTTFLSFDIIIQYYLGYNLFGLKSFFAGRNSGVFGAELIAGTYLQKFSFFSIFISLFVLKNKNYQNILFVFLLVLHLTAITFTGDRMPTLLTLMGYGFLFVFFGRIRFMTLSSLILFFVILFPIMNNDEILKQRYVRFVNEVGFAEILKKNKNDQLKEIHKINENTNGEINETSKNKGRIETFFESNHGILYLSAIETWKTKPIFGVGYKSYRTECAKIKTNKKHVCSTHPHNYYLELLTETGLVGTILILIVVLLLLKYILNYIFGNIFSREKEIYILAPIIVTFLLEIWPIKSTGAIFTTWNGTLFWIILSLALTLRYKKNIY